MKADRICAACGTPFTPLLHIPHQRFCSDKACQRACRRAWQDQRMRLDPHSRENQMRGKASWSNVPVLACNERRLLTIAGK